MESDRRVRGRGRKRGEERWKGKSEKERKSVFCIEEINRNKKIEI